MNAVCSRVQAVGLVMLLVLLAGNVWASDEMPGRSRYPHVKWIELTQLKALGNDVVVVDARSQYEYETMHIKGAVNVVYGEKTFLDAIRAIRAETKFPIVFYCNGRTCMKSYQAAQEAQSNGVSDVLAFDAGIFDWVKAHPTESVLLGVSPVDPASLIGSDKLKTHMLAPAEFESKVDDNAIILDVRDRFQQDGTLLFPMRQHSVPLDNKALQKYVEQAKEQNKTLLIYDEAGHQVRWLQYYLEAEKVTSYYFLAGGSKGYFQEMMGALGGRKAK